MSQDQFAKLFKYMQAFRQEVDGSFSEVDKRFDDFTNLIDGYADKAGVDLDRMHV
jgi:hypothetical protein